MFVFEFKVIADVVVAVVVVVRFGDEGDDEHDEDVGVNGYEDFEGLFIEFRFEFINDGFDRGNGDDDDDDIWPFFDICMAK